jgi:AraC-like DNA-binding protein
MLGAGMLIERATFRALCRARDILSDEEGCHLSIPGIGQKIGISPFHFIRLFEATFGTTPHQFRIGSRLARAKELLAVDQRSVTEVCMEVGFSSLGSFSLLFTKRIGTTPSSYRRRHRAMIQVPAALMPEHLTSCLGLMGSLPTGAFRSFREA